MAALLTAIGVTEIYRLNPDDAFKQGLWIVIGVGALRATLLVLRRDYRVLESYKYLFGLGALALLVLPALPGSARRSTARASGCTRGRSAFQPGEFAKLAADRLPRGLPAREARGARARAGSKDLGPLLLIWGGAMLVLVADERPRRRAPLLRDLPRDALRRDRRARLRRRRARRSSSLGAAAVYQIVPHVAGPRRRLARPLARTRTTTRLPARAVAATRSPTAASAAPGSAAACSRSPAGGTLIPYLNTDFIFAALAQELGLLGAAAIAARLHALRRARLPHRAARATTVLEAARGGPDVRLSRCRRSSSSAASLGPHPADRHHAAVRQLRRLEPASRTSSCSRAAAGLQPRERGAGAMNRQIRAWPLSRSCCSAR